MIVIVVLGILTPLIFGPLDNLYQSNIQNLQIITQVTDTRSALRQIERTATISNNFLSANSISDISGNIPGTAATTWDWRGNPNPSPNQQVLITENYATDTANRLVMDSGCSTVLKINYVYFVSDGNLYRRTLKTTPAPIGGVPNPDPTQTNCIDTTTIAQKRTCRVGFSNSNCEGSDNLIVSGVTSFTISYYLSSTLSNALTGSVDGAKTIVITLTTAGKNNQQATATMQITRMNGS